MNWYERELMAKDRERELDRDAALRRRTGNARRPAQFWLLALLRAWTIGVTR